MPNSEKNCSNHARIFQRRITVTLLLLAAGTGIVAPAYAANNNDKTTQAADGTNTLTLEPINVSASALAHGVDPAEPYVGGQVAPGAHIGILGQKEAANVPFSVVSFTGKMVRNQQSDTVADVLESSAAVQTISGYGNYAERYMIRGFVLNNDDISFGGLYGVLPRQVISTQFVSRVELFKGANSFVSGVRPSGSGVGGTVNLVPKTAGENPLTRVRAGYTSEAYGEAALDVGRRFGPDDRFGVRVNLLHGAGEVAIDGEHHRTTSATIALDYQGERAHALFFLGYQKLENDGGRLAVLPGGNLKTIPEPPDAETNYTPDWAESETETVFGMLRGGYDLSDNWTAYGAIGANKSNEHGQYSMLTLDNADGDATAPLLVVPYEAHTFTGQAGLRGHFRTGPVSHQVNIGYAGLYRKTSSAFTTGAAQPTNIYDPANVPFPKSNPPVGDLDNPNVRSRVRSDGFALSDTLGFFDDRLLLTLGLRYQDIEIKNYSYQGKLTGTLSDDAVSPVYGLVFKLDKHISIYYNHIESLQPGKAAPSTAANAGETTGITEATQNEVGVKYITDAFGATLSLYRIEKPSAYVNKDNVYGYYGEQRNRGVEISFYGEPVDGLRLFTSATWIDAELTEAQNSAYEGNTPFGVPQYRIVLGGEWDIPYTEHWTVLGQVVHNGPEYADKANDLELDSWTRLDLGVRYRMPMGEHSLVWRANVKNVTGADYWKAAGGSYGYLNLSTPRTFKLSATFNF